jgi:predicted TIM-barrel fold metal-dependent hydrolase
MRRIGLDHFVFGTDWPEWTPANYRDDLASQLPLTTAEFDAILTNRAPWLRGG